MVTSGIVNLVEYLSRKTLSILTFHRIVPDEEIGKIANRAMCITITQYKELIDAICRYTNPISLSKACNYIRDEKSLPRRSVVITFDDGYYDNYCTAYPLLKKRNIHSTIFITTGFINKADSYLWWDEIEYFLKNHYSMCKDDRIINEMPLIVRKSLRKFRNKKPSLQDISVFIHQCYSLSESERDDFISKFQQVSFLFFASVALRELTGKNRTPYLRQILPK